jgi:N-acetylgalactosamine kinase
MSIYSIILAAGAGTRMGSTERHKVCFEIDGQPAIERLLDTCSICGIGRHVVVVGDKAQQVMVTVARTAERAIFAYQAEQRGTGHAAKQGARILQEVGYQGPVLVMPGDKVIEPSALNKLITHFRTAEPDLAFLVGSAQDFATAGRIVCDETGRVLADIELADVKRRLAMSQLRTMPHPRATDWAAQALRIMGESFPDPSKAARAFGSLHELAQQAIERPGSASPYDLASLIPEEETLFHLANDIWLTPQEVEQRADQRNVSVYLFRAPALYWALERISDNNAQQEEYLTDCIALLAQGEPGLSFRVEAVPLDEPHQVMGFNNPAELLAIQDYFRRQRQQRATGEPGRKLPAVEASPILCSIHRWLNVLEEAKGGRGELIATLSAIYGEDPALLAERIESYQHALHYARKHLGPQAAVLISHSPGRINIMGRHVDHQGGRCNLMAIDREILAVVRPRSDDRIRLFNADEDAFGPREFSLSELVAQLTWDDWHSLVNSDPVRRMIAEAAGDWSLYVQAALLRLQKQFPQTQFQGLDMVVSGNVPIGAGLSSSSALVVATAEATVAVNQLNVRPQQFVDLCGEGEWFVGTRGGSADHAAMKFAQKGAVAHVRFFPFGLEETVTFPSSYRMVICNSGLGAQKAMGARDIFNHRVACYHLGVRLVRRWFPQYAPLIEHLRDINPQRLGVPLAQIYRILSRLPEHTSRRELTDWLTWEEIEPFFATHAPPQGAGSPEQEYPIRGVVLYGLAECERSCICLGLLKEYDMVTFGQLMNVSHDGDRVTQHDAEWNPELYSAPISMAYLLERIEDLESGNPARVTRSQLHLQPGSYRCSTPELDLMADIAQRTEGVMGAQLAGAGLGGCIMALAQEAATDRLIERLTRLYYEPRGLEPQISVCTPISGSGVLTLGDSYDPVA